MKIERKIEIVSTRREEIRSELIKYFLEERPGTGTAENTSFYSYTVDSLEDGNRIILKRPAILNKGFDFEVHIENIIFDKSRNKSMPSHSNIIDDLKLKLEENQDEFKKAWIIIDKIYSCNSVSDAEIRQLKFTRGHPIEGIIKAIKWLFIEQDITYWNWSGRNKFYTALKNTTLNT